MARLHFPRFPDWLRAGPLPVALIGFGSTLLAVLLLFGVDRATNGGEVLGSVVVNGVNLGGLSERDATARLRELEDTLRDNPVPVTVAGKSFMLDPRRIGLELDETAVVDAAMRHGRTGNVLNQLGWWLTRWGRSPVDLTPAYSFDRGRLDEIVREWETEGIAQPAYPGDVRVDDGTIVYEYPATGTGIEAETAAEMLEAVLLDPTRPAVTLPTRFIEPALTPADIDAAVSRARDLVGGAVTLANDEIGTSVTLPATVLARALLVERDDTANPPSFTMSFDQAVLGAYLAGLADQLETEPVDAEIVIDDVAETVEILPSVPVMEPDPEMILAAVDDAIARADRTGFLPYREGREADFSTADAEALGIRGLIGKFTTNHACCQNRVINIQLMADTVDGAMVMPGETFSLNDHVGQRTTAKGYVCAGALQGNELVEEGTICIGGGTSQFTTTIYNATFFAGLEDVAHTPHSVWFSRYPEGREATIGWRTPEFIFRNNTPNALIIRTSYTPTSITVKIYGDNGGLEVEAGLSNRYNHTGIVTIKRQVTDNLPGCKDGSGGADTFSKVQSGSPGWSVTYYRYITYPDGTKTTESWSHRYQGMWEVLEFNPADPDCAAPPPPPDP